MGPGNVGTRLIGQDTIAWLLSPVRKMPRLLLAVRMPEMLETMRHPSENQCPP